MKMLQTIQKIENPKQLEAMRKTINKERSTDKPCVSICSGTGCMAYGCLKLIAAFGDEISRQKLDSKIDVKATGCPGFCERGTVVSIRPQNIFYQRVKPENVSEIISETLLHGRVVDSLLYTDPVTKQKFVNEDQVPFYSSQKRLLMGNNSRIDPTSIDDYLALGGYSAMAKALTQMTPEQVIEEVKHSGLRGRGGGGFPTAAKWQSTRDAPGDIKYVIVNCDEGDPGAFMDRAVMEGNPHSVLEGLIIGAYAIGAHEGYIYVRNEYPLAVKNARIAIDQAMEYGLLGENILGSGFDFTVKINKGGGAFICGESSALMASLEGKVGEPRAKYVHTVEKGLWDRPSNLNNVETWANVPLIINQGAQEYSKIGTKGSKGTKIFSLVGKINNTGLVEVPMGMTLRQIIYGIGGGIPLGKKFKAVQTGGPSGGCIPEKYLDTPVDFDELTKLGSMMGSGGMIVMDEDTCMVDVAKYFIDFLKEESCGKCVPCREGVNRMSEVMANITQGKGKKEDLDFLGDIADVLANCALCALGTSAANPVLTTIRYFKDEYTAHIEEKKCPAGVCRDLIQYSIDAEKCTGCLRCLRACSSKAISGEKKKPHTLNPELCIKCGACYDVCKFGAVVKR